MVNKIEKLLRVVILLIVLVVLPVCYSLRVQQINEEYEKTNTISYYEN